MKIKHKFSTKDKILIILAVIFISSIILVNGSVLLNKPIGNLNEWNYDDVPRSSIVYESGDISIQNQYITEAIFIMGNNVNVTIINSTISNNIYTFNRGILNLFDNSSILGNIIFSDYSYGIIINSSVNGNIECRDNSKIDFLNCVTPLTNLWKFNSANLTLHNVSFNQLNEFGTYGSIKIYDSNLNTAMLNGYSSSLVYFYNTTVSSIQDSAIPIVEITGPAAFISLSSEYQTSERTVTLTWIAFDSPLIDGFLNLTFEILVDGNIYTTVNFSGYQQLYSGSSEIELATTGMHNISIICIDSAGNNYTSTLDINIIDYPSFNWMFFGIGAGAIGIIALVFYVIFKRKQDEGYYSSLGIIFKRELQEEKLKSIIFTLISVAPGIILYFVFAVMNRLLDNFGIDQIRLFSSYVINFYLQYLGVAFTITFASSGIINAKSNGVLSWFLSKPVRRWEFLWGKILTYIFLSVLISIASAISFTLGGILFVDTIYYSDIISMGGYIFLIGLLALIPLTALSVLFSTLFRKSGLAIFLPILILMILPTLVSFLPLLFRHEWPLLLSYPYYLERLGNLWISQSGGGLSSAVAPYSLILDIEIVSISLNSAGIILILSAILVISLIIATLYIQRIDIT
ncbi:MAG: hypothetical protein GF317_15175 [Candidatus Lokiarchaeota archaeon]|nr:hypothetical protein [Candidatus Lokiarchaeota archaeon]MBD3200916.1 hypothetical protein [Candidatus Lokiarchaeota archaeon]